MKPWEKAGLFSGIPYGIIIGIYIILLFLSSEDFASGVGDIRLIIAMAVLGGPVMGAVWGIFIGNVFEALQKWIPTTNFIFKGTIFGTVLGIIGVIFYGVSLSQMFGIFVLHLIFGLVFGYFRERFDQGYQITKVELQTERKKIGKSLIIIFGALIALSLISNFAFRYISSSFPSNITIPGTDITLSTKFEIPPYQGEPNKISGSKFESLVNTINGCIHYQDGTPLNYPTVHLVAESKGTLVGHGSFSSVTLLSSDEKGCFEKSGRLSGASNSPSVSYLLVVEAYSQRSLESIRKAYIFDMEKDIPLDLRFP